MCVCLRLGKGKELSEGYSKRNERQIKEQSGTTQKVQFDGKKTVEFELIPDFGSGVKVVTWSSGNLLALITRRLQDNEQVPRSSISHFPGYTGLLLLVALSHVQRFVTRENYAPILGGSAPG